MSSRGHRDEEAAEALTLPASWHLLKILCITPSTARTTIFTLYRVLYVELRIKNGSSGSCLRVGWLLAAYAVLNALLYSGLLPLWEGFDEPFHFGYTQQLANLQGWPDPRISRLSAEIGSSLLLAPESYPVRLNLPQTPAFADYYRLPLAARDDVRRRLWQIPTSLRRQPGEFMNYEALQAPLAYMLMALPERMLSRTPLPERVAILRLLVAIASSLAV